jgi:hypothetical protein
LSGKLTLGFLLLYGVFISLCGHISPGGGFAGGPPGGGNGGSATRLWYLDENGKLLFSRVVTGATDGKMTEIVRGEGIREGMDVITGLTPEGEKAESDAGSAARALRGGRF